MFEFAHEYSQTAPLKPAAQPVPVGELVGLGCDTVGSASNPTSAATPTSIVNFFVLRRCLEGAGQIRRALSTCIPTAGRPQPPAL